MDENKIKIIHEGRLIQIGQPGDRVFYLENGFKFLWVLDSPGTEILSPVKFEIVEIPVYEPGDDLDSTGILHPFAKLILGFSRIR